MIECPHCHVAVVLMADGRCPACWRDPAAAGAEPDRRALTFRFDAPLPQACLRCGVPTGHQVRLRVAKRAPIPSSGLLAGLGSVATFFLAAFFGFFTLVVWAATSEKAATSDGAGRLDRSLPLCPACRRAGVPAPEYVDYERRELTLVVHADFYRRVSGS